MLRGTANIMAVDGRRVTYSFPLGGPDFAENAKWLAKSIIQNCEDPNIVVGVRPNEWESVSDSILEEMEQLVDELIEVERPRENYPISVKIQNMVEAAKISDRDFIVHLDSDVFVLNDISDIVPDEDTQWMKVKEVDFGSQYWGSEDSEGSWRRLFEDVGAHYPGRIYKTTLDDIEIPPFFNAAMVVAPNSGFPQDWLEMTKYVWDEYQTDYSDQIALGLLSKDYEKKDLDDLNSWNLPGNLFVPSNVDVLRYEEFSHLLRVPNLGVWRKILSSGLNPLDYFDIYDIPVEIASSLNLYRHLHNLYLSRAYKDRK